jgi:hypothetical protein
MTPYKVKKTQWLFSYSRGERLRVGPILSAGIACRGRPRAAKPGTDAKLLILKDNVVVRKRFCQLV